MTTPTNWPNPERPGVPMFPERDGWHILQTYSFPGLFYWDSENQYWFDRSKRYYRTVSEILVDAVETKYISICLTPTQIAEILGAERELCAKVCDSLADDFLPCHPSEYAREIWEMGAGP